MNEMDMGSLEGRSGIITGAASGIGKAAAMCLAGRGAQVAVVDLDLRLAEEVASSICEAGGSAFSVCADVSDAESVSSMVSVAKEQLNRIDFLVNNAGIIQAAPFADLELDKWNKVLGVNLTGAYLCSRAVLPHLLEAGEGGIVNVSSMAGRSASVFGGAHYTASKAGLIGLTRHLARELGPMNIRVNSLCPGFVLTPLVTNAASIDDFSHAAVQVPLRRYGAPEEQAEVIAFLLSKSSTFITGATIDANGGAIMI